MASTQQNENRQTKNDKELRGFTIYVTSVTYIQWYGQKNVWYEFKFEKQQPNDREFVYSRKSSFAIRFLGFSIW